MKLKRIISAVSAIAFAASAFVSMAVSASAKEFTHDLKYFTSEGTELGDYDHNADSNGQSVVLSLNDDAKSILATDADNKTATISYTLAGYDYIKGNNSNLSNNNYRSVVTVAGKKFYFNANTNNNNNTSFPNGNGDYYISSNK